MPEYTDDQLEQLGKMILAPQKGLNLGPFLVALVLDAFFLGILLMQAYKYFSDFRTDLAVNRCLGASIIVFAIGATILGITWMYHLFVTNFGSYRPFLSVQYLSWFYVFDCVAMLSVQTFFAYRAFKLAKRNYFALGMITIFMMTAFITGIMIKVRGNQLGSTADPGDRILKYYVYIWLGTTVLADMSITAIILTVLVRSKTGWKVTDRLITRLVRMTFESQAPPTVVAVGLAIEYSVLVDSAPYVSIPFIYLQSKVYAFALFHTLNSRSDIEKPQTDFAVNTISGYTPYGSKEGNYNSSKQDTSMGVTNHIQMTTEIYTRSDQVDIGLDTWSQNKFSNRKLDASMQLEQEEDDKDAYGSKVHIVPQPATSRYPPFSNYSVDQV